MVSLANDPPDGVPELVGRCRDAGLVVDMPVTDDDLGAIADLVTRWTQVVDAAPGAERAQLLNLLLREGSTHPRLSDHAGTGWHLHYRDDAAALATVVRALAAVGTALHLTGRGMDRLGRCACAGCDRIFADVSRTGRQRYCSTRCSTRDAVRRHRAAAS
jgi:predicted RNA-binding Zn ribbon-like protein